MTEEALLELYEGKHRARCGDDRLFCYVETYWFGKFYRLSFVEEDEPGFFPTDTFGPQHEMRKMAERLNTERLKLTRKQAMMIVASSMTGSVERARRSGGSRA